jgi:hypothetical protein
MTTSTSNSTFIYRRWSTQGFYVDSKNERLTADGKLPDANDANPYAQFLPPKDGSCPFLELPVELRLHIFSYLSTDNNDDGTLATFNGKHRPHLMQANLKSYPYADLYRSPGRVTRCNATISKHLLTVLHVCHAFREEVLDACFDDRIWVIEASFYDERVAGLCVLPSYLLPSAWVKRLLILTAIDLDGRAKRLANLQPLQQMTNLREVHIVFGIKKWHSRGPGHMYPNPVVAIAQSIPASARVHIGADPDKKKELLSKLGEGINYLFRDRSIDATVAAMQADLPALSERQGTLHVCGRIFDPVSWVPTITCTEADEDGVSIVEAKRQEQRTDCALQGIEPARGSTLAARRSWTNRILRNTQWERG